MKQLTSLLLLLGASSTLVHAYNDCVGCEVLYIDDYKWGVENNDWCCKWKKYFYYTRK